MIFHLTIEGNSRFHPIGVSFGQQSDVQLATLPARDRYPRRKIKAPHRHILCAGHLMSRGARGSTLLVRMEDVVLRLYDRVARVSAVREAFGIDRELVRCRIVVEHRISPPAGFGESLAVFFHDESLGEKV